MLKVLFNMGLGVGNFHILNSATIFRGTNSTEFGSRFFDSVLGLIEKPDPVRGDRCDLLYEISTR